MRISCLLGCCQCCCSETNPSSPQPAEQPPLTTATSEVSLNNTLNYEDMQLDNGEIRTVGQYRVLTMNLKGCKGFLHFFHPDHNKEIQDWKVHVSLSREDEQNIIKGCNIVIKILAQYDISHWKCVLINYLDKLDKDGEQGKIITIYSADEPTKTPGNWIKIFAQIEDELIAHNIQPGPIPRDNDRQFDEVPIENTLFFYCRNDSSDNNLKNPFPTKPRTNKLAL